MTDPNAANRPSTPNAAYRLAAPDLKLIRDLLGGTRVMHLCYKDYIPKYSAEKQDAYKRRATSAKVYGGLSRTLSAAVGMLFAKPPKKSEHGWTPEIESQWENIDGLGAGGFVFAKRRAKDALADGFGVILVDHPKAPDGVVVTAANSAALGLRPIWVPYARADVLSWRTGVVNNVTKVTQVVLREAAQEDEGDFGTTEKLRYRVCKLVRVGDENGVFAWVASWRLLEESKDGSGKVTVVEVDTGTFVDATGAAFDEIPVAVLYANDTDAPFTARPPLLDVAFANLEHWQIATGLRYYEDRCAYPQPTLTGSLARDQDGNELPFVTGPGVLVKLTNGSTFDMKELAGTSLEQLRASKQEAKDEISELGMSFLSKRSRAVETAEAKRLDATAENSTLGTAAQSIEDGINQALVYHARYLGIPADQAPTIQLNRDFDLTALDPQTMAVYIQAVKDAGLPPGILVRAWIAGGRLPADTDVDALITEMLANQAAAEAQRQAELAAQKQQQDKLPAAA